MESDIAGEGAVFLELDISVAGGFVHFVVAGPGKVDAGLAIVAVETTLVSNELKN
ncbi:hypothetical protein [Nguyenibacter vanlangensis]|uniref:Uncharacterized protein n=1 Tax=Nguyenibacter vanlangensis TaxID=1216886 RepID=A0A7Y7M712_9PROT|nr:hypothetical protein [Nguyenibacter vanlangensis]NVN10928.1 hypothetical protein [Nguyenibacter vanlangensis]